MGDSLLGNGVVVAVIGICTVFLVLILLWFVLAVMQRIFAKFGSGSGFGKKSATVAPSAPEPVSATPETTVAATPEADDDELIAVLTAAVASSLNTSTYNLRIQSYRQVPTSSPAWNRAARTENVR